jgi:hypothetical protein
MPLMYGEGRECAFSRLHEAIERASMDKSFSFPVYPIQVARDEHKDQEVTDWDRS